MTTSAPWVQCAQPHSTAVCRLICSPHAGGSADDMSVAADRIARELAAQSNRPYALFGHSMGGAIAYEVARLLHERSVEPPRHLFVSGRQPPMHQRPGEVHTFDDSRLASELLRLSNANEELLAEPELAKLMFPIIRNDYRLIETYRPGKITVLTLSLIHI